LEEVAGETAVVLQDGAELKLRPLEPNEREQLVRLFHRLSPETVYKRFLSPIQEPSQDGLDLLLDIDHRDREAVAAVVGDQVVGVARYARRPGAATADFAVLVEDAWQGKGLSRFLIERLTELARRRGIEGFRATIHSANRPAIRMVRRSFPAATFSLDGPELEADLPFGPGATGLAAS
jgi:GNAT superfamily N-acetyltransferase